MVVYRICCNNQGTQGPPEAAGRAPQMGAHCPGPERTSPASGCVAATNRNTGAMSPPPAGAALGQAHLGLPLRSPQRSAWPCQMLGSHYRRHCTAAMAPMLTVVARHGGRQRGGSSGGGWARNLACSRRDVCFLSCIGMNYQQNSSIAESRQQGVAEGAGKGIGGIVTTSRKQNCTSVEVTASEHWRRRGGRSAVDAG